MKIMVYAHRLEVGGTQVNAIELAEALRDRHGHDVVLFAAPGPMLDLANAKGLRFRPAPETTRHPSPARMRALRAVVRQEQPDLVHAWDWPQALDAFYGVQVPWRTPMLVTVMSMVVPRFLPRTVPTTFGTPELVDRAKAAGRSPVGLVLPPVDTTLNAPDPVLRSEFRTTHGIGDGEIAVVAVSRLVEFLKLEGLRRTIEAVGVLGGDLPLRLIIVGDGPARAQLTQLAGAVNTRLGRDAVTLPGALLDPRPAYAGADIVAGMGGSSLRALAFGAPTLVLGERGFARAFTPDSAEFFHYHGMYGIGDGDPGNTALIDELRRLVANPTGFVELGAFSREFVLRHFSLGAVAERLDELCQMAATAHPARRTLAAEGLRTAGVRLAGSALSPALRQRLRHPLHQPR